MRLAQVVHSPLHGPNFGALEAGANTEVGS